MFKQKVAYLQQALWKLQRAKELIVLGSDTKEANLVLQDIDKVMENIEAEISVLWE